MKAHTSCLQAFREEMKRRRVRLHGAVLLSGGKVIDEVYNTPYTADTKTRMYSSSKSVTAMAIGKLIGEGRLSLDDRITEVFADRFDMTDAPALLKEQTIRQMLCMTTVYTKATYSEKNTDWLASYFRGTASRPAGTLWRYDSCGSYVLGAVVKHITGMDFVNYLRPEFDVMGVSPDVYCLRGPDGEAWASSGFIATTSDLARIASVFLNGGRWGAQQLIPEAYARDAISPLVTNQEKETVSRFNCGYGYQIWGHPDGAFAFHGKAGQVAIGFPGRDLVFACNCDTEASATTYDDIFYTVESEILPHFPITDREAYERAQPVPCQKNVLSEILGRRYRLEPTPMGIETVTFTGDDEVTTLCYTCAGQEYRLDFSTRGEYITKFPEAYWGEMLLSREDMMRYQCSVEAEWVEERKLLLRVWAEDTYVGNFTIAFYFCEDGRIALHATKHAQFFFNRFSGSAYGRAE